MNFGSQSLKTSNPETLTGIQKRIYNKVFTLKNVRNVILQKILLTEKCFSNHFFGKTVLNQEQKRKSEALLLKYHYIFARHRLDIGANEELKVKLTPENGKPMYTQGQPISIHYT